MEQRLIIQGYVRHQQHRFCVLIILMPGGLLRRNDEEANDVSFLPAFILPARDQR